MERPLGVYVVQQVIACIAPLFIAYAALEPMSRMRLRESSLILLFEYGIVVLSGAALGYGHSAEVRFSVSVRTFCLVLAIGSLRVGSGRLRIAANVRTATGRRREA